MVSKNFVVGSILAERLEIPNMRKGMRYPCFIVLGHHNVFKFLGNGYVSICKSGDFTASSIHEVVDDPEIISYLRERAQQVLGDVIQEIEEGVFDD
jgi:hypothetical protein